MSQADATTHIEDLRRRVGAMFTDDLDAAATAASAGEFRTAATQARQLAERGDVAVTAVVRDALAAGTGWWDLGQYLGLHPQAAYERHGTTREGTIAPARQRPELAVALTAGLAAEHDWNDAYGIDIEDLGADHSLFADPTVVALRQAAQLLGDDIWIAVRTPGEYEGEGEADEGEVIKQWTTVVLADDELTWLKEALQLNAVDDRVDPDEELEPLH